MVLSLVGIMVLLLWLNTKRFANKSSTIKPSKSIVSEISRCKFMHPFSMLRITEKAPFIGAFSYC